MKKRSIDKLALSHIPAGIRQQFTEMLRKYESMSHGSRVDTNTVKHHIDLQEESQLIMQRPYICGPHAPKFASEEVEKMLDARHIEPTQSECPSPVVMATNYDGSYSFCSDYARLNSISISDTYPLQRKEDCID